MHPAGLAKEDLLAQCDVRKQRRSGPGGQHRNKVETGVFLEHKPTGIRAEATEKRSQARNLELGVFRLRLNIALNHRSSSSEPPAARPSDLWMSRTRGGKISVNVEHNDFPVLLSEALDRLAHEDWDVKAAAQFLECSSSQLVKFLKKDGRALSELNQQREQLGLGKLK